MIPCEILSLKSPTNLCESNLFSCWNLDQKKLWERFQLGSIKSMIKKETSNGETDFLNGLSSANLWNFDSKYVHFVAFTTSLFDRMVVNLSLPLETECWSVLWFCRLFVRFLCELISIYNFPLPVYIYRFTILTMERLLRRSKVIKKLFTV